MTNLNPYEPPNPGAEEDPPLVAQLAVDGEGMTIEFEQTLDDILALQDFHVRQQARMSRQAWLVARVMVAALSVILAGGIYLTWPDGDDTMFIVFSGSLLALLFLVFYYSVYQRWNVRRWTIKQFQQGRNLNLTGHRRITITPEFLIMASPLTQSACRWLGVEKILQDEYAIYVYVSTMNAHVLPRRAFNSDRHYQEFAAKAAEYLAASATSRPGMGM